MAKTLSNAHAHSLPPKHFRQYSGLHKFLVHHVIFIIIFSNLLANFSSMLSFLRHDLLHSRAFCLIFSERKISKSSWLYTPNYSSMNGVFAINKPSGPTSRDVVDKLKFVLSKQPSFLNTIKDRGSKNQASHRRARQRSNYIKIGHGGTLDPLADGVLVIGVGTGTRSLSDYLGRCRKTYLATAMFGVSTTTYDSEGKILEYGPTSHLTKETIAEILASKFSGDILQTPPVYSALKMNGKPLYEYARNNEPLPKELKPRECKIDRIEVKGDLLLDHKLSIPSEIASVEELNMAKQLKNASSKEEPAVTEGREIIPEKFPIISIEFSVSSGTYIRSLIHDIGLELGTAAHMVALTRLSQGEWELENNVFELSTILEKDSEQWMPVLKTVLKEGPKISIDAAESLSGVENTKESTEKKSIEQEGEENVKTTEVDNGGQTKAAAPIESDGACPAA